jgi:hypothetical protein
MKIRWSVSVHGLVALPSQREMSYHAMAEDAGTARKLVPLPADTRRFSPRVLATAFLGAALLVLAICYASGSASFAVGNPSKLRDGSSRLEHPLGHR